MNLSIINKNVVSLYDNRDKLKSINKKIENLMESINEDSSVPTIYVTKGCYRWNPVFIEVMDLNKLISRVLLIDEIYNGIALYLVNSLSTLEIGAIGKDIERTAEVGKNVSHCNKSFRKESGKGDFILLTYIYKSRGGDAWWEDKVLSQWYNKNEAVIAAKDWVAMGRR